MSTSSMITDHANNIVRIGASSVVTSRLGIGCEQLGGTDWGNYERAAVERAIGLAVEQGVTFFDTADVYGLGESERRLSHALGRDRHRVVIATKFGVVWRRRSGRAETRSECSPKRARRAVEDSLRRLRVDRIPLYQVHRWDPAEDFRPTLDALRDLQRVGKIAAFGVSNYPHHVLGQAAALGAATSQFGFSLMNAHLSYAQECKRIGLTSVVYGVLGHGLFGRPQADSLAYTESDRRHRLLKSDIQLKMRVAKVGTRLHEIVARTGKPWSWLALAWAFEHINEGVVLCGVKRPEHVQDAIAAWRSRLPTDMLSELNKVAVIVRSTEDPIDD